MNADVRVIQKAYADLAAHVFLQLRNGQITESRQLHDLGDALHNISDILNRYGEWIDDLGYRRLYLSDYDAKWAHKGLNLTAYLEERIKFHAVTTPDASTKNLKFRLGYLVNPKPELLKELQVETIDHPFGTIAVITAAHDYEKAIEGRKQAWLLKAKQEFMADFLHVWSKDYPALAAQLRSLPMPEAFDRWWTIAMAEDVIEIDPMMAALNLDAPSEHAITLLQALSEAVSRLDLFGYDLFLKRRAPSRGPCRTITTSGHSLKIQGEEFERGYFVCCSLAIDPKKQWSVVFGVTLAWNHEGWFVQATTEEEDERRENLTRSLWESPAYRTHSLAEVVTALSKAIDALVQSVNEPAVAEVLDAIEKR